jgi:protein-disulfide isomerase
MNKDYQNLTKQERRDLKRQEKEQRIKQLHRKRLINRATLWSLVVLLVGGAIFGMIKLGTNDLPNQTALLMNSISPSDWNKGNKEANVVLVEYSDFQCPACGTYYPLIKQLNQNLAGKIQFAYRHFPLKQIHANAELSARAAEAAGKQDRFWEMHDMLFENQSSWSNQKSVKNTFVSYAQSLQLDIERFESDLNSKEVKEKVENDYQSGIRSGVNATPTFFLNGQKIQNPRSYGEFRNLIEQAINTNP